MKAVLVTGGRDYDRFMTACEELAEEVPDLVIHGCAAGADTLASRWTKIQDVPEARFPASWGRHGKMAGPMRNAQMVRFALDLRRAGWDVTVVAFPGGRGAAHCKQVARRAGLTVREVQ